MSPRPKKPTAVEKFSVAEATRQVVDSRPSVLDALREEIVNFTALAEMLYPAVLSLTKKERVNLDSIKMALMRYCDQLKERGAILETSIMEILANSVLELKNDLVVVTVKQDAVFSRQDLFKFVKKFRFFQLIQGTKTFTLLVDQNHRNDLYAFFTVNNILDAHDDQSAIILTSSPDIVQTPGIVAYLSHILAEGGINITQIMSCYTDTIFIVERNKALEAYTALEEKIFFLRDLLAK
ncbi:MAG: DUF7523 family protein [Promethearchaeota archaeon]